MYYELLAFSISLPMIGAITEGMSDLPSKENPLPKILNIFTKSEQGKGVLKPNRVYPVLLISSASANLAESSDTDTDTESIVSLESTVAPSQQLPNSGKG